MKVQLFQPVRRLFLKKGVSPVFFLYILLCAAFIVRIINLNYNSAFNDEAIYVVVGRLGLFAHDWWSYGANLWMAGLPYIYPTLTTLAYHAGGLEASRFLNVVFGVLLIEEVYRFVTLLNVYDERTNRIAGLIAAFLVGFSGIGIFVSRFATYDMPSFLLLMVAINSFLKAEHFSNGKYYAIASLSLFLAFLTKIVVAIFFPILLVFSYVVLRMRHNHHQQKALFYFYIPLVCMSVCYGVFYHENIISYITSQYDIGRADDIMQLLYVVWEYAGDLILMLIPVSALFFFRKKLWHFFSLILLAGLVPVFHILTMRLATFDKHLYLSIIFMSVAIGYGLSVAIYHEEKVVRRLVLYSLPILLIFYMVSSYHILMARQYDWPNTVAVEQYLRHNVRTGDKVLTQEGGAIALALYDNIFPPDNIVTFDWIAYSGMNGEGAYILAVQDKYFDYIEVNTLDLDNSAEDLRDMLLPFIKKDYVITYQDKSFVVYERKNS